MSLRAVGLTAGFALAANAFMIPSTISLPQLNDKLSGWPSLDITRLVDISSRSRIAKLPCSDCAFPVKDEQDVWSTDIPNSLIFDFAVSDDGKSVILNGERIYPIDHAVQLKAPQVASDVPDKDLYTSLDAYATTPRQLDFALGSRTVEAADGTDAQLIDIDLRVFGVDGSAKDLGALSIRLLRDTDGAISIADVENVPVRGGPKPKFASLHEADETIQILPIDHPMSKSNAICNGPAAFLCRFVAALDSKVAAMRNGLAAHSRPGKRPCPGKMGKHGFPLKDGPAHFLALKHGAKPLGDMKSDEFRDMMMHHGADRHGPQHHRGHRNHGPADIQRRVMQGLKHFFFGFVVPVLIGVAAGMAASALGMVVGTFLAWAWIKFVRGGRRYRPAAPQIFIVDTDNVVRHESDEKVGLMTESTHDDIETAPPSYVEKE